MDMQLVYTTKAKKSNVNSFTQMLVFKSKNKIQNNVTVVTTWLCILITSSCPAF